MNKFDNILITGGAGYIGSHIVENHVYSTFKKFLAPLKKQGFWDLYGNGFEFFVFVICS